MTVSLLGKPTRKDFLLLNVFHFQVYFEGLSQFLVAFSF